MGYVFPEKKYNSIAMITNFTGHRQNSYYGQNNFDAEQISGYYNIIWQSAFKGNLNHKYNAGTSLKYENLNQILNDSTMTDLEVVPGVFFQYTGKLFEKMNVILGARADYHNQAGLLLTPRVNLKYNLTGSVTLRASAGKGYRKANVLAENSFLLASSRDIQIANNLELEEAWNYGANITLYVPIGERDMAINAVLPHRLYKSDNC
jgi:outer membrane receptor for ferrienterochelin and colicin